MKLILILLLSITFVACSNSSNQSDANESLGASANENHKIAGTWSFSSSRIDQRLGQISNQTFFYFRDNNELEIISYVRYAMAPAANAKRIEKGTYRFADNKLSMSITESTCGQSYPSVPMDLFSGLGTGELQFVWPSPDNQGHYSLYLYFNSSNTTTQSDSITLDLKCDRFK